MNNIAVQRHLKIFIYQTKYTRERNNKIKNNNIKLTNLTIINTQRTPFVFLFSRHVGFNFGIVC